MLASSRVPECAQQCDMILPCWDHFQSPRCVFTNENGLVVCLHLLLNHETLKILVDCINKTLRCDGFNDSNYN